MQDEIITYEQPLNEHIRVCLRLEHLFEQIVNNLENPTDWGSRTAILALLETVNVIDRPDLKTKLTKALTQHAATLTQLEVLPQVDGSKLRTVLSELDRLIDQLYATQGKIGHNLRGNEFLNTIRQHLYNPGGAVNFSNPGFQLWLQQPSVTRINDLKIWVKEFDQLRDVVNILLRLTRQSSLPIEKYADNGFYQQALDPNATCEMVRVMLPVTSNLYPEISVGRHRLSVRFLEPNCHELGRSKQCDYNLKFKLTCCAI
ncbi:MAG: cell division protein ZapD [Gammaproteobacteria bacterium]|nr:cell division protein ZapD [Gammaproteobacteria bacterium]